MFSLHTRLFYDIQSNFW